MSRPAFWIDALALGIICIICAQFFEQLFLFAIIWLVYDILAILGILFFHLMCFCYLNRLRRLGICVWYFVPMAQVPCPQVPCPHVSRRTIFIYPYPSQELRFMCQSCCPQSVGHQVPQVPKSPSFDPKKLCHFVSRKARWCNQRGPHAVVRRDGEAGEGWMRRL